MEWTVGRRIALGFAIGLALLVIVAAIGAISLRTTGLNSIEGAPPDLSDPPPGCRFHPRCPDAMQICERRAPVTNTQPNGSRTECWAADQANGLVSLTEDERIPLAKEVIAVADEA